MERQTVCILFKRLLCLPFKRNLPCVSFEPNLFIKSCPLLFGLEMLYTIAERRVVTNGGQCRKADVQTPEL